MILSFWHVSCPGYFSFYHHLLKPYEHYLPVWVKDPADTEDALRWALDNDPWANATAWTWTKAWRWQQRKKLVAAAEAAGAADPKVAGNITHWEMVVGATPRVADAEVLERSAAARVAAAGQSFAAHYLTKEAVTCYWFRLLHVSRHA